MGYINDFWLSTKDWLLTQGLKVLAISVLAYIAFRIARVIINRIFGAVKGIDRDEEMIKRADTLAAIIRHALSVAIIGTAAIMILSQLGVEIGPVLAAAGVVGLAIGFGAQTLVQDVISGFFILMEDQVRVGDVVSINGTGGRVEKVSLRLIVLRDFQGRVHYIRNGKIDLVSNLTKGFSYYVFEIGVAYRENTDEVVGYITEVDREIRADKNFGEDILEPMEIVGVDKFDSSAVIIKARIKTKPIKQWRIGREYNRRLKMKFDEKKIEIPYPHLTIYMGQDKAGQAPPLRVNLTKETN
jgi:small conductance mechanosensitive channel